MTSWPAAALDALVPDACACCDAPGAALCQACTAGLHRDLPARRDPTPRPAGLPPVYASGVYADELRRVLLAYKEHGRTRLAPDLARLLGAAVAVSWAGEGRAPVTLVGVPSTARARRQRGHDHVDTLAVAAARALAGAGISATRVRAVRRRRARDQSTLSAAARAANARASFVLRRRAARLLHGRAVVVVDDIVTTGATAAAVSGVLREAGVHVVAVAAIAATARRGVVKRRGED